MADKKRKVPPKPAPPRKPQKKEVLWMACRAKTGCPGQQAERVWSSKTPGGGNAVRYRCTTCGGSFHINT